MVKKKPINFLLEIEQEKQHPSKALPFHKQRLEFLSLPKLLNHLNQNTAKPYTISPTAWLR